MHAIRLRHVPVCALMAVCLLCWGCATKPLLQRGWIGGGYHEVKVPPLKLDPSGKDGPIAVLPEPVLKEQSGAVLVDRVYENTPLSEAGIREGDLLCRIGDNKITCIEELYSQVDAMTPGETIFLGVFRNGQTIEKAVKIGKESYKKAGYLSIGLRLVPEIRMKSGPDISLLSVVSFKRGHERMSLQGPRALYLAANVSPPRAPENFVWDFWLGIFGLGRNESIVKQETAGD
ncbi:MAG: PDZ domain-containing protein [Syntrophobacteraceae bacterium]